jgi:hypothetical protein
MQPELLQWLPLVIKSLTATIWTIRRRRPLLSDIGVDVEATPTGRTGWSWRMRLSVEGRTFVAQLDPRDVDFNILAPEARFEAYDPKWDRKFAVEMSRRVLSKN